MLRLVFLFLVVLGALAIVLGLVAGVGIWRAGHVRAAGTQVAGTATTTRPADSSKPPANAAPAPFSAPAKIDPSLAAAKPAAPIPPVPPPDAKPIILLAKDAELHGDDFRLVGEGNAKTIVNWVNRFEVLEWVATIPKSGEYEIVVEYAADPNEFGGAAELMFGASSRGILTFMPTASWDDVKMARIRTMLVPEGKTSVILRPYYIVRDRQLIHVRSVRLTLLHEMNVQTAPDRGRMRFRRGF